MKRFHSLDPKHLAGLGYWFWFRENVGFINRELVGMLGDYWNHPPNIFTQYNEWLWFIGIPFFYTLGFFIGPWFRKSEAFGNAKPDYEIYFYNKKNIEYMTILHTLSGGKCGY